MRWVYSRRLFGDEPLKGTSNARPPAHSDAITVTHHTRAGYDLPKNKKFWKSMLPKRRFWNVETYVGKIFCKHFSALLAQIE